MIDIPEYKKMITAETLAGFSSGGIAGIALLGPIGIIPGGIIGGVIGYCYGRHSYGRKRKDTYEDKL